MLVMTDTYTYKYVQVGPVTQSHAIQDIDDAVAVGLVMLSSEHKALAYSRIDSMGLS